MHGKRNRWYRYGPAAATLAALGCWTSTAAAQVANDTCSTAEVIAITSGGGGAVSGNSTGAGADAGLPACTLGTAASTGSAGVWYSFIGTGNRVSFESCGQTTDFVMRVFCGDCNTPICAASDDDGCVTNSLGPRLALCTTPGAQYYLLFAAYNVGTGGAYTINWSDGGAACPASGRPLCGTAPVNDECSGALPVSIGGTVVGTTIDATPESVLPAACGGVTLGAADAAVWYSFVGNGSTVTVSSCSAITGANNKIGIYTGSCGSFTCAGGGAATTPTCGNRDDSATAVAVCTVVGQTYYIAVSNETNGAGLFELSLTSSTCFPPPANDNCSGALPITPGTNVTANTSQATNESPAPPGCTGFSTFNLGVWYTFTPATNNRFIASTCNAGTTFNTRVYVYTGSCGAFTCVGANAVASPACGVRADAATVSFCAQAGVQHYILVTNDTTGFGDLELSLTDTGADCTPPVNDQCAGALPITPGVNVTGDTVNATNETPAPGGCSGFSTFNLGMWYTFTPTTANRFIASTCNAGTNFNTRVYVYTGSCGAFTCVGANAVASPACGVRADAATVSFCGVPGTQYYILVTNDTAGTGIFELSVTDTGADCTPPANDNCSGALPIGVGQTVIGNSVNATNESPVPTTCNGLSTFNLGMWYTFTEGATARRLNISTCDANTNFNTRVYVYTGSCGAFTCVNANAVAAPACGVRADAASVTFCTTPGVQYYFLVTNDTTGTGTFGLALSDTGLGCLPPANDNCSTATLVTTIPFPDTVAADTAQPDLDVSCNAAANAQSRAGVWYRYTPTEPGAFRFTETGSADVVFTVFTGADCGSLSEVFCNTDEAGTVSAPAVSGTQYFILVSMNSDTAVLPSTYVISINYIASPGACCVGTSCTVTAGAAACTSSGGAFLGYGVSCGGGPLAQNLNVTPVAIPDFPAGGPPAPVTSSVTVTDASVISDLNVHVKMNHTFIGDVYVRVTGPNNATVDLIKRPNIVAPCAPGAIGDGDDMVGTYTFDDDAPTTLHAATIDADTTVIIASGRYIPSTCTGTPTSLDAAFGGISAAGTWTLTVSDEDEAIVGTLEEFGIIVNGVEASTPCTPTTGACCSGVNCSVLTSAACTGPNTSFSGAGSACNVFGTNNTTPCCLADYNHVGGVTVQDIFDFLIGYFAQSPQADSTGNGVTVQDIFDYLSLYFVGCN